MGVRLEKRLEPSKKLAYLVPVVSVFLALVVSGIVLLVAKVNPFLAYGQMVREAFGTAYGFNEVLVKATPLILCGLGVMLAFKMLFWNIGAEGQLHMGAWAATAIVMTGWDASPWLMVPTMVIAGMIGGALWALIPALLKVKLNCNEIITTLLMNYVAIYWVQHFIYGPWKDPVSFGFPMTKQFPDGAQLFRFADAGLPWFDGTRVHLGFVFAVLAVVILYFVQEKSRWGYEVAVTGGNPRAATYAGMNAVRNVLVVMCISGGLAGLAGMSEVCGIQLKLVKDISPHAAPYGYTAIIIAWLARRNPWGVLLVSLLMGGLYVGGETVQITMKLPVNIVLVIQALILFFVLGGDILARYRLVFERREVARGG
jgi:simple sugar transport system permease protein